MILYTYAFDDILKESYSDFIRMYSLLSDSKTCYYHKYRKATTSSIIHFIDTNIEIAGFEDYLLTEREV